jgi:multiple sugar transport system permease protein
MRAPRQHLSASLITPALVFAGALFVAPFVWLLWLSLTDRSFAAADRTGAWTGLANYRRALSDDPVFIHSLGRSAAFTVLCVVPELGIAVALTEFLYRRRALRRYLLPLLAVPALLPNIGTALYWRILLQGEFGILSYSLAALGVERARAFLSNADTILLTLAIVDIWQWAPFVTLLLLAVRLALPQSYVEAALLDGATSYQAFRDVTLPLLQPALVSIAIVRAVDVFKEFDKVYVLTGGGPGTASELVSLHLWRTAFKYWDFGYAAALSVIVYVVLYLGASWSVRWTREKESA